jgi:hypothetical protein
MPRSRRPAIRAFTLSRNVPSRCIVEMAHLNQLAVGTQSLIIVRVTQR